MAIAKTQYRNLIAGAAADPAALVELVSVLVHPGHSKVSNIELDQEDKQELAKAIPDLLGRFVPAPESLQAWASSLMHKVTIKG